ncbi:MAG: hypothetical protein L0I76_25240 [Pseudonocardia sp.]|nr:hypothetical protein [Pseudonocardia sp.]
MLTSVAARARAIAPRVVASPWPGHEYARGFGAFAVPMAGGDVLCLRVLPENTVAPYASVWHRAGTGAWTIYVNTDDPEASCPKYYGPAARALEPAAIELRWPAANRLEVEVTGTTRDGSRRAGEPVLRWSMTIGDTALLRGMNAACAPLPRASWKPDPLVRARELVSERVLGMGAVTLRGITPSGHLTTLCPVRIHLVTESRAVLSGRDLGGAVRLPEAPTIGEIGLPARPTFAFGEAYFRRR